MKSSLEEFNFYSSISKINKNDWTKTSVSQDFNENNTVYRFVVYERKK